ncbi:MULTISPECIES: hypothetical protein [Henriciella]|jgi:hypothetical protein|uniref:Uncharacterized protein n=1 Tax=Henriciella pelagia TaxID=1977912 RepID=A0ABQ1JAB4_9PROT|nr:hypothetical protein [Henriciella pelagia]GGB63738.1 hypothetical protein GCM10011503_10570 [Henriciella pelagia]
MECVNFRGRSGRLVAFTRMASDSAWARHAGVALFASRDTYGWRIVRMVEMTGRMHDVQPFWAELDAKRYGASAIFVHDETDFEVRRALMSDLEAGLSPVFPAFTGAQPESLRLAA